TLALPGALPISERTFGSAHSASIRARRGAWAHRRAQSRGIQDVTFLGFVAVSSHAARTDYVLRTEERRSIDKMEAPARIRPLIPLNGWSIRDCRIRISAASEHEDVGENANGATKQRLGLGSWSGSGNGRVRVRATCVGAYQPRTRWH